MTSSPPRCLVVDCGGVTNKDSGVKTALARQFVDDPSLHEDLARAVKARWAVEKLNSDASKAGFWRGVEGDVEAVRPGVASHHLRTGVESLSDAFARADAEVCSTLRTCFPDTLQVLRSAKEAGVVTGMISNHVRFWFDECAEAAGLPDLIPPELVIVSNEVACSKPSPGIFRVFLERLKGLHPDLSASDCVFVDNKAENVDASVALGFIGVLHEAKSAQPGELAEKLRAVGLALKEY